MRYSHKYIVQASHLPQDQPSTGVVMMYVMITVVTLYFYKHIKKIMGKLNYVKKLQVKEKKSVNKIKNLISY